MTYTNRSRRHNLPAILAFAALLLIAVEHSVAAPPAATPATPSTSSMKEIRKKAAERHRRILFNNDGGAVSKRLTSPTAKAILDDDTTPLAGTQVDTILYCSRSSGFGLFTHFTKVGQMFTSQEAMYAGNQMKALIAAGIDPLQVQIDFAKQHGIELFWSMRMNDTHDGSRTDYAPIVFRANKLKMEHPEYLLGTEKKRPKYGAWTAVDYGRPEIRDLAFRYFEEVCKNYDVDGIELDFSRHPVYFKSNAQGKPATDTDRAQMTELVRRIRTMADEVGQKRGRPILIAMRLPDSVEYARDIGFDMENWLANDLLDFLIVSSYFQLNEWDYSVKLARKYGVKIYPSLDDSRAGDEIGHQLRITPLAYRARAAEAWASGADGIYLYNALGPDTSIWQELGDPKVLAKLDKDYFVSVRGAMRSAGGNLPIEPYLHIETLNPKNPVPLKPGKTTTARMNIGETFGSNDGVNLNLRLRFNKAFKPEAVQAAFNGAPLKLESADDTWLSATVPASSVKKGRNQVELTLADAKYATAPTWLDCLLEVRHSK